MLAGRAGRAGRQVSRTQNWWIDLENIGPTPPLPPPNRAHRVGALQVCRGRVQGEAGGGSAGHLEVAGGSGRASTQLGSQGGCCLLQHMPVASRHPGGYRPRQISLRTLTAGVGEPAGHHIARQGGPVERTDWVEALAAAAALMDAPRHNLVARQLRAEAPVQLRPASGSGRQGRAVGWASWLGDHPCCQRRAARGRTGGMRAWAFHGPTGGLFALFTRNRSSMGPQGASWDVFGCVPVRRVLCAPPRGVGQG